MELAKQILIDKCGEAIGGAAAAYVPVLKRMAMQELVAAYTLLNEKKIDEVKLAIRGAMTPDEQANEIMAIGVIEGEHADAKVAKIKALNDINIAVLKAAFSVLLSAVLL